MEKIELKRANVVKVVDSEDKAKALEAKGFVRTDGKTAAASNVTVEELKEQLVKAGTIIASGDEKRAELEEKLKEASEHAQKADKENAELKAELSGVKEQLEASVKQNRAASKK
nr:MAG TPA: Thymopoietin protein [Caudoviricetes sp.]